MMRFKRVIATRGVFLHHTDSDLVRLKIGCSHSAVHSYALEQSDGFAVARCGTGDPSRVPQSRSTSPHADKSSMLRGRSQSFDSAHKYIRAEFARVPFVCRD